MPILYAVRREKLLTITTRLPFLLASLATHLAVDSDSCTSRPLLGGCHPALCLGPHCPHLVTPVLGSNCDSFFSPIPTEESIHLLFYHSSSTASLRFTQLQQRDGASCCRFAASARGERGTWCRQPFLHRTLRMLSRRSVCCCEGVQ